MPSSRTAATATRNARGRTSINRPAARAKPKRVIVARSLAGIRWDRMGRVTLLVTLAIVGVIGAQRVHSYLAARTQAASTLAQVRALTKANAELQARQKALSEPATIAAAARRLGMVRIGEHPYSMTSAH